MGRSVNKVQIIGTLGRDPEMKLLPNGNAVVTVSVATDESYNDKSSGQKVERTEWHRLTAFGKLAEIVGQYLKKGSKAYFEGKLKTNEYEKDGIKRYSTEIVVNDMMMLDGRQDAGMGNNGGFANTAPMSQPQGGFASYDQQPAQQPQQGGFAPQGQQPQQRPAQQPQQGGYSQPQAQPAQGGFAPQQAAPQQGGYAQSHPAQQPQAAAQHTNNFENSDDIPF
jgi:single-strand DNA-binding protein